MIKKILIGVVWLGLGLIGSLGLSAFFQRSFTDLYTPYFDMHTKYVKNDVALECATHTGFMAFLVLAGPFNLVVSTFFTGFYEAGFSYTCPDPRIVKY